MIRVEKSGCSPGYHAVEFTAEECEALKKLLRSVADKHDERRVAQRRVAGGCRRNGKTRQYRTGLSDEKYGRRDYNNRRKRG